MESSILNSLIVSSLAIHHLTNLSTQGKITVPITYIAHVKTYLLVCSFLPYNLQAAKSIDLVGYYTFPLKAHAQ